MLFDKKSHTVSKKLKSISVDSQVESIYHFLNRNDDLNNTIGRLQNNKSKYFFSDGAWSAFDLLSYCLRFVDKPTIWICSWSVSEHALQQLLILKESGKIESINMLLEWRLKIHKPAVLQLAKNICDRIKIGNCHAKISILSNNSKSIGIVSSANYTKNPRIEAGAICTDKKVNDMYIHQIDSIMKELPEFII